MARVRIYTKGESGIAVENGIILKHITPVVFVAQVIFMGSGCSVCTSSRVVPVGRAVSPAQSLHATTLAKISACDRDWKKKGTADKVRLFAAMKRDWVATFDGIEKANLTGTFSLEQTGRTTDMVAQYRGYLPQIGRGEEDETEEAVLALPFWEQQWVLAQMYAFVAMATPVLGAFQGLQLLMERKVAELNVNREEAT